MVVKRLTFKWDHLKGKCVFKMLDWRMFLFKLYKYHTHFQPLEVVGGGSETQLQVGEK